MNFLAHGMRFLDRPYFLAGTAVPDWLRVADRRVRVRARRTRPFADGSQSVDAEVAAGVLQHLADDDRFHGSRAFVETSSDVAARFRRMLGPDDGFRPGFLGHITTELLLDAVLMEQHPRLPDAYYEALAEVDAHAVQTAVNRMARGSTGHLAALIAAFRREQFLRDYLRSEGMLYRLNQVMRRVGLPQLPDETTDVIRHGRSLVRDRADDLLPDDAGEKSPEAGAA